MWFQASTTKQMRTVLLWVMTQQVVEFITDVSGQPIGPIPFFLILDP
jgi:hypothetical protein